MGYAETIEECCRYIDRNFQKELSAIELRRNTIIPIIISAEFFR